MQLTKKEKTIKYCVYAAVIVALALVQNVRGLMPEIFGARCFLIIPACVLLGVGEDEKASALIGLFGGVLWDCVATGSLGFNALFIMTACYILSVLITHLLRATFWLGVCASALTAFLYCVIYWLVFVVSKGGDGAISPLWSFYLPSFVYTSAVSFLMNLLFVPLKRKLNKQ